MFNISIEQPVLMKALEYLGPTVGKNTNGLGDNCVSMKGTGKGSIDMYTTNTIETTKLEAIVSLGGNSTDQAPYVDYARFRAIIASIPANEVISLKASVNDLLIDFGANSKPLRLVGCTTGMLGLPNNQFAKTTSTVIPKSVVQDALNNACAIISDSASTPIYNCLRLYTYGMDVEITALDVNCKRTFVQFSKCTSNNPNHEILVEASKLKKSMKLFEDYNEMDFYMDQYLVLIQAADPVAMVSMKTKGMIGNIEYYCRRLNGSFPANIGANFSPGPVEFAEVNKADLLECFARVKAIEDQTSASMVDFEATNGEIIVSMTSTHGVINENVPMIKPVNSGWKTVFKYPNLSDILKVVDKDTFEIGVLPSYPNNYVVRATGQSDVMFTVPSMTSNANAPTP